MIITKKQIKLTPKKITGWLTMTISFFTIIALILVSLFLYDNFYQVITQTKEIMVLKEKVALDTINMEKFNQIMEKLTKKITPKELSNIVSPFR